MDGTWATPTSLQPLPGGFSGETFLADTAGEQVVVRIYGQRSARRGPLAPEIDAAVLGLVGGLLPVPEVLEVRPGDPEADVPGLLVTSRLPGQRLDLVLPTLSTEGLAIVGAHIGTIAGRLRHMVQPRRGAFVDRDLTLGDLPDGLEDLTTWLGQHEHRLEPGVVAGLRHVVDRADDLLVEDRSSCLVHSDLNAKNVLIDPATLQLTGVLDWEFAHSGSPWTDLGNVLRFERDPGFTEAVLDGYRAFVPQTPDDLLDRARATDLVSLVELAARADGHDVVRRSRALLAAIASSGDLHAWPG